MFRALFSTYYVQVVIFQKHFFFTVIKPKYDIVIWQKFYIYCFSTLFCSKHSPTQLKDAACKTQNVEFLSNQWVPFLG